MRSAIERAVLCGYDWGGRAACIVAALWPERVRGLVTGGGYNMHDVAGSAKPASAEQEHRYWYQYYFCTERGRAGLTRKPPRASPGCYGGCGRRTGRFDDATFEASARSFDNPDFVDVVIHSYRVRYGYVAGDPALADDRADSLPRNRRSPCRRSRCRARPSVRCRRMPPRRMHGISPDRTSAARSRGSATIFRKRRRARPPRRCWNWSRG